MNQQANNPTHGVTLEAMLTALHAELGWAEMARQVDIRCFSQDPSIKSSLVFLRRTPWARAEVEQLYVQLVRGQLKRQGPRVLFQKKPAR